MLLMSILSSPFGIIEYWFINDYWRPELFNGWRVGLEDFLFMFVMGGIAGVIYEELFGKNYSKRHHRHHPKFMIACAVIVFLWFSLSHLLLRWNTMYSAIAGLLLGSILILTVRHDLIKISLMSGLLTGLIFALMYFILLYFFPGLIQKYWLLHNLSGIFILGIPIEELGWAFSWGMVAGPAYECTVGLMLRRNR